MRYILFFFLSCKLITALPINPVVLEGDAKVEFSQTQMRIECENSTSIRWDEFSIGRQEIVQFMQSDADSVVFNHVKSATPSNLLGKLEANGQVVLINPNGILVGKDAVIDTGSLIASTFDSLDQKKMGSEFVNDGKILTRSGKIQILSRRFENRGSIHSPTGVFVKATSIEMGIENFGFIESKKIFLEAPTGIVSHYGNLTGNEVRILGASNHLHENSLIDVSSPKKGGTVLIGGDYKGQNSLIPNSQHTWVASGSTILADAVETGDGGKVILWADETNFFRGTISAKGGILSGDGGFVEISSKGLLDPMGQVDTLARRGKVGKLLLDPTVVVLSTDPNSGIMTLPPPGYVFSASPANINIAALIGFLGANDVIIDASLSGPAGVGSITLNASTDVPAGAPITWTAATKLSLIADGFIDIRDTISATNGVTGATTNLIEMSAPVITVGDSPSLGVDAAVRTTSGQIQISAPTSLTVYSNTVGVGGINAGTGGTGSLRINCGTLDLNTVALGGGNTDISAGTNIDITATDNIAILTGDSRGRIATITGGDLNIVGSGNIDITAGTSVANRNEALIWGEMGGNISVQITGDITIRSGSSPFAAGAAIAFTAGAGSTTVRARDITLLGTLASPGVSFALIGSQPTGGPTPSGPIAVTATGANGIFMQAGAFNTLIGNAFGSIGDTAITTTNLTLNGSTVAGASSVFTLIGTFIGNTTVNASGDINIFGGSGLMDNPAAILSISTGSVNITADNINLIGGSSFGSFATVVGFEGSVTANITGDYFFQGGSADETQAGIIAGVVADGDLTLTGRNYTLISGSGGPTGIGSGEPDTMAGANGNVSITATGSSGITMVGGSGPITQSFISSLGTGGNNSLSITLTHPNASIDLTSGSGSPAFISTNGGPINLNIPNNLNLTSTGANSASISVGPLGNNNLTVRVGNSMSINSLIQNLGGGDIILVVDANFPQPFFGTGSFTLGTTASLTTTSGAIRIFTSQQILNSIDGLLNGLTFTPGTLFNDTNQEIWCTYFPSNQAGNPFTIFYKECEELLASQAEIIISGALTDLHSFNEFPGWWKTFSLTVDNPELGFKEPFFLTVRHMGTFWNPKSYTVFLHSTMDYRD